MRVTKGPYTYDWFENDDRTVMIDITQVPEEWESFLHRKPTLARLATLAVATVCVGVLLLGTMAALVR